VKVEQMDPAPQFVALAVFAILEVVKLLLHFRADAPTKVTHLTQLKVANYI
jgi:hypothetical protein